MTKMRYDRRSITKLKTLFARRPSSILYSGTSDAHEEETFQEQLSAALRVRQQLDASKFHLCVLWL